MRPWLSGRTVLLVLAGVLLASPALQAQIKRSSANLPYRFPQTDASGNTWMLFQGGRLMQQGNSPMTGEAATISVNGQGFSSNNQSVMVEGSDVVLEGVKNNNFSLTRRFTYVEDSSALRIVDVIRNQRPQDVVANITLNFSYNYGVQSSRQLTDPRKKERVLANIVTDGQGRIAMGVFGGAGSKAPVSINANPNNSNQIQAQFEVKIPGNREIALVHFHYTGINADAAEKVFASLRDSKAISSLSGDLRKLVINYANSAGALEEIELPRGGLADVIELRNGDLLRGDLLAASWEMDTRFGKVSIPADKMLGMASTPGLTPGHLLISSDGEILGGRILSPAVKIKISSGQEVSVPPDQVQRIGRRSSLVESFAANPAKPLAYLRTGDRLAIVPPNEPIKIATRFGVLSLPPQTISMLDLQPEQSPVHMINLTDASRFSGVLLADEMSFALARGGTVKLPVALLRRISFAVNASEDVEPIASLSVGSGDVLSVTLPAQLKLITSYGEVDVNGNEVKTISRMKDSQQDIQITLWDDSILSGRLARPVVDFTLAGGATAQVPVGAIEQYTCVAPQPSSGIVDKVKKLVAELNADDWKQRERAEAELLNVGAGIIPTLNQLRANQPPEAQQRIDSILKQLEKGPGKGSATSAGPRSGR